MREYHTAYVPVERIAVGLHQVGEGVASCLGIAQSLDEYVFVNREAHGIWSFSYALVTCSMVWNRLMSDGNVSLKFVISPSAICKGTCPSSLASVKMD